jgi:hypothetical protein
VGNSQVQVHPQETWKLDKKSGGSSKLMYKQCLNILNLLHCLMRVLVAITGASKYIFLTDTVPVMANDTNILQCCMFCVFIQLSYVNSLDPSDFLSSLHVYWG